MADTVAAQKSTYWTPTVGKPLCWPQRKVLHTEDPIPLLEESLFKSLVNSGSIYLPVQDAATALVMV